MQEEVHCPVVQNDTLIRYPAGGSNQSGLRDQNARLVLSYLRRHGALPSAEIARRSGLSAQTVSNIIRALTADGLIARGAAIKGKVGKPSIPVGLNAEGVLSFGLSIGRRATELVLVDFDGTVIDSRAITYPFPVIDDVFAFLRDSSDAIMASRPGAPRLLAGIGVARPNNIWQWLEVVNAPAAALRAWRDLDLKQAVAGAAGVEAFIENDATSACVAEHLQGRGSEFSDFAYIFMGAFVGGGLVLNGTVVSGATRNAAALGPLPVTLPDGGVTQLLNVASLHVLETALVSRGIEPGALRANPADWSAYEADLAPWIENTARYLAFVAAAVGSIVEVEAVLIDGAMPEDVRARLTDATRRAFAGLDATGIEPLRIEEAAVGRRARSIGAALLPIHARYFVA
ncbi:MAG: ROK family transcriptional regulator [Pseudomonadota bacterium]